MSKMENRNYKALNFVFVVCVELEIYNLICKKKKTQKQAVGITLRNAYAQPFMGIIYYETYITKVI